MKTHPKNPPSTFRHRSKAAVMVCTVLALSSCADMRYHDWDSDARAKVTQGHMRWSEYYRERFARLMVDTRGKVPELEMCNTLQEDAVAFENGKIDANEWDVRQRRAQLDYARRQNTTAIQIPIYVPASF